MSVCNVGKITRCIKFLILMFIFWSIHRKYRTVIGQVAVPKVMMQNVNDVLQPDVPSSNPIMYHYRNEMKRLSAARSVYLSDSSDNDIVLLVEDHQGDNSSQDEGQRGAQLLAVVGVD